MPATQTIRKLIVCARNMRCARFKIEKSSGQPKLSEATLHERVLGGGRIDDRDCSRVIARDNEFVSLQKKRPMLESNNNREKFQGVDRTSRGRNVISKKQS